MIVRYSVFMLRKNYKFGQMAHFLCDEDLDLMLGQRQDFEEIRKKWSDTNICSVRSAGVKQELMRI